ncbi:MAG TPA: hypothetical protein VFB56_07715 [Nitrospiraceae bacterium]|nr:hypothetical protein [Nitrospiraceae bacterium]
MGQMFSWSKKSGQDNSGSLVHFTISLLHLSCGFRLAEEGVTQVACSSGTFNAEPTASIMFWFKPLCDARD